MCLLDTVIYWDASSIHCRAVSHRLPDNPLRSHGRLGASCGIEYAAQAMAVHGALLAESNAPKSGYLVSARSVEFHVHSLDDIDHDLIIEAVCAMRDEEHMLYEFQIKASERLLMQGRAAVVLNGDAG